MWVARWWETCIKPDGAVGRRRRAEVIGTVAELPTRRQATQVLSDRLRSINDGTHRLQSTRPFADFVEKDWAPVVLPTVKYATQRHYHDMLHVHLLPAFRQQRLSDISRETVQGFLAAKLGSGLSWKTVSLLRAVLSSAEEWGYIQANPVRKTKLPRRPAKRRRAILTPAQIQQLAAGLDEPARSLVLLLVLTGLRVGELLALRWGNIDLNKREMLVEETVYEGHFDTAKTRHGARQIPVGPEAAAILAALHPERASPDTLIFAARTGKPLNRHNLLQRKLHPTCKRLGLPAATWHWLRHCHATMLDAVGAPLGTVQAQLGHSTPEVTRHTYLHSIPEEQRRAVESFERLLFGPKWTQILGSMAKSEVLND